MATRLLKDSQDNISKGLTTAWKKTKSSSKTIPAVSEPVTPLPMEVISEKIEKELTELKEIKKSIKKLSKLELVTPKLVFNNLFEHVARFALMEDTAAMEEELKAIEPIVIAAGKFFKIEKETRNFMDALRTKQEVDHHREVLRQKLEAHI